MKKLIIRLFARLGYVPREEVKRLQLAIDERDIRIEMLKRESDNAMNALLNKTRESYLQSTAGLNKEVARVRDSYFGTRKYEVDYNILTLTTRV